MKVAAYLRLMRFHKPVGILLLWFPTAWALWMANQGKPAFNLIVYFSLGTIFMRAAGCIVNDIADRNIDRFVLRTQLRPLTTGEVSLYEALILLFFLLLLSLLIVIQLPITCFYYALIALGVTVLYPFCKRYINAPQLVLGIVFSMGIPMAYAASSVPANFVMLMLFVLNFAWIVSYDTIYALADKEDDLRIGVKSTAILFGEYDRMIILLLQLFFHSLWLVLSYMLHYTLIFYVCWSAALGSLIYQQYIIVYTNKLYISAFSSNVWYGLLLWCGLMLNYFIQ